MPDDRKSRPTPLQSAIDKNLFATNLLTDYPGHNLHLTWCQGKLCLDHNRLFHNYYFIYKYSVVFVFICIKNYLHHAHYSMMVIGVMVEAGTVEIKLNTNLNY